MSRPDSRSWMESVDAKLVSAKEHTGTLHAEAGVFLESTRGNFHHHALRRGKEAMITRIPRTTLWMQWVLLLLTLPTAQNAAAQQVTAPIRQVGYGEVFQPARSLPRWEQGYLVSWRTDTSSSDTADNLFLDDRDGITVRKARIWLEGASFLRIEDAAARKDGRVVVVGWAVTNSGTVAAFLADVSVTQRSAQIIQTSPFEGQAVGFGPDGTIWALGLEVGPGRGREPAPDHYLVEHFGADGLREAQYLRPASGVNWQQKSTGYLGS